MSDIQRLIKTLQSNNDNQRYDACEELRVAPSLPPEALEALRLVINDVNPDVADAAQRALALHTAPLKSTIGDNPVAFQSPLGLSTNSGNFGMGAITGSATLFTISVIAQIVLLGEGWNRLLIFTVIGALILGIPAGGFGGLILVKMWKTYNAAYIGGAIAGVILVPVLYIIFLLWLFLVLGCC